MAKPYSQDLRDRVIEAVERGKLSRRAAARHYEVSESVSVADDMSGLGSARSVR